MQILFRYLFIFIFPFILLLANGCGVWRDFTTYFNLYYNTSNLFEEAESKIQEQKVNLFATDLLNIPGNANQDLAKVIEKSSNILQFHPNSSFIDDALLILGKSFYYQKNYQKALRKFQELIATQEESDLRLETELWIGKTEMRLRNFDNALTVLRNVRNKAIEEEEDEIITETFIEEIKYNLIKESYQPAIDLVNELLKFSDDETSAEVYYELGLLYLNVEDYENAIASFEKVPDFDPVYEIEYSAQLELAKTLHTQGNNEKALSVLNDMKDEIKYSEEFPEIDLQRGIALIELKNFEEAVDVLKNLDTAYVNSPSAGAAKFQLGELYEYGFKNFDSASIYYLKASSSQAPPEYLKKANDRAVLFKKYEKLKSQIAANRKQLLYSLDPEEFVKDSIAFYADTLETLEEDLEIIDEEVSEEGGRGNERLITGPDWIGIKNNKEKKTPPIRLDISIDSLETLITKDLFELGNIFLTEFNMPDSAYIYYSNALENYPNSVYQARILYSLGNYYEAVNMDEKADSLFNYIYENYKNESVANASANKINKPLIDLEYDPAKELYVEAEKKMLEEKYDSSLTKFYDIYNSYPSSPFAPKALYASGWILENELKLYDSAAVVYDTIAVNYPQSQFASLVRSKVTTYKQEKERAQKVIEDSLRLIEQRKDSLAAADSLRNLNRLSSGTVPSDTTRLLEHLSSDSLRVDSTGTETIRNYIEEGNRRIDSVIKAPDQPVKDSLQLEHQTIVDSLRRDDRRQVDSLRNDQQDLDTLDSGGNRKIIE